MKSLLKWEHTQGSKTGALKGELRTPRSGFLSFLDSCQLEGGIFITWGGDFLEAGFCAFSSLLGQGFWPFLGPAWFGPASCGFVLGGLRAQPPPS